MPTGITRLLAVLTDGGSEFPLAEAALRVSEQEYPGLDVASYLAKLAGYADAVQAQLGGRSADEDKLEALNHVLFAVEDFLPNSVDYYDPRNCHLNMVIDRKQGIPITLSLIYIEVGRRIGLALEGVSFPAHFLVKLAQRDGDVVLDPYFHGMRLDQSTLAHRLKLVMNRPIADDEMRHVMAPVSNTDIIVRLLHNLRSGYEDRRHYDKALAAVDTILLIAPERVEDRVRRAALYELLGHYPAAIEDYRRYLEWVGDRKGTATLRRHLAVLVKAHPLH